MLEICANNIHLMLIKNEQKYVNILYISRKELKTVHKKIKAICLNIIHYLIMFYCLFKKGIQDSVDLRRSLGCFFEYLHKPYTYVNSKTLYQPDYHFFIFR